MEKSKNTAIKESLDEKMPVIKQEKVEETYSANSSIHTEQKESLLNDEQQSIDSNLNNQNTHMTNGNHNENYQILSAFNELFEQFVVFKREKEEFEDKMELERVIQKDRLQILEENLNIIKLKLENSLDTQHPLLSGAEENTTESFQFNSNHNNGSDFDVGNDQSIEFSKGRKSSVFVNGENNDTKEKNKILEQEKSNEDSSLDVSKRTLRFNKGRDKTPYKGVEKEDEEEEEEKPIKKTLTPRKCKDKDTPTIEDENEKAKKEILNSMSLGEEDDDADELMEDSEEISIASLTAKTSTASKLEITKKSSKSPVKRGSIKELSEDAKEDRDIDNFMRSAERASRSKARVNYKSESDDIESEQSDKKKMPKKVSSKKQEEEEEESENDDEEGENDEEKNLSKENCTSTDMLDEAVVDENLEAKKSLQDMMNLNSDLRDSLDELQSDNEDNDEEEDAAKEKKPKKEKKKAIIDEKLSPSKLDKEESDTEKKTKPRLKVPNLCSSGSSDEEDKEKKKADKGKLRLKIIILLKLLGSSTLMRKYSRSITREGK
jgi:hypothetical protein